MSSTYEIEFSEPDLSHCECCGGLSVRLTRFVHRNGDAFAIYYAAYSNNHDANELSMLIALGEWGDESGPEDRVAFYCRVRPTKDSYEVMLDDASASPWANAKIVGQKLTRAQALAHAWKTTAFEVLDEAFLQDPSLRGFLHRVHCGSAATPLEPGYGAPDEIFALAPDQKSRALVQRSLATLDDDRFFIRCLLPLPVEGYERWCIGLWVEVSKTDFDECRAAWDVPDRYARLHFIGRIANDVATDWKRPITRETEVTLTVPDVKARPQVTASPHATLAGLLARVWPRDEFETYAVARGSL